MKVLPSVAFNRPMMLTSIVLKSFATSLTAMASTMCFFASLILSSVPIVVVDANPGQVVAPIYLSPTNLPTLTPTASPTSMPSATPSKSTSVQLSTRPATSSTKRPGIGYQDDLEPYCFDNADFYVNEDHSKTCQWIGSKVSRLRKFCAKQHVASNCPSTCEIECGNMDYISMRAHFINRPLTDANATSTSAKSNKRGKKKVKASRKRIRKVRKMRKNEIMAKKFSEARNMEKKRKRKSSKA